MERIRFIPPEWTTLAASLSNWEKYYHSDDDPLVRLAIVHAQFEFLHPFLDGNGRIGRILVPIFLFEMGLLSEPVFYLSEYLERNRDEYIDRLNALNRGKSSWRSWTEFFLNGITEQAKRNAATADEILGLYESLKDKFLKSTRSRYAIPLLGAVFELQYFQAAQLRWNANAPSKQTLMSMLQSLERDGVIQVYRMGAGRRSSIWWLPELIRLVEESA